MSTGRQAFIDFTTALALAPEGSNFEVGLCWDPEKKWLVYQRIGDAFLKMTSEHARGLYRTFEKAAKEPQWRNAGASLRDMFVTINNLASEAYHNNQAGVVPEGGVGFMQPRGRA